MNKSSSFPVCAILILLGLPTSASTLYVAADSRNPVPPYGSWATAASNIQDAVDAASPGSRIVVYDGIYRTGGRLAGGIVSNRVAITKPVHVESVSGPATTTIEGYNLTGTTNAIRCVYLSDGASLTGFKLTLGGDHLYLPHAGGLYCDSRNAFATNCVIVNNASGAVNKGTLENCTIRDNIAGCYGSTLHRCVIAHNSSWSATYGCFANNSLIISNSGGSAANSGTFNNCTLIGNLGREAAAYYARLTNCIIYYNAPSDFYDSQVYSCCAGAQFFGFGYNNFTNEPAFVDLAGGDFRLSYTSPCINAGNNLAASDTIDLAGNPRIVAGTIDIGAYEFQVPRSLISHAWLLQYQFPLNGSADTLDSDNDGLNNWQEWVAGTVPTNAQSLFKVFISSDANRHPRLWWESLPGKFYSIERSTKVSGRPAFSSIESNLPAAGLSTSFTDASATGPGPFFYRISVR